MDRAFSSIFPILADKQNGVFSRLVRSGAWKLNSQTAEHKRGRAAALETDSFNGLSLILWQSAGSPETLRAHRYRHLSGSWEAILGHGLNSTADSGTELLSLLSPALRLRVLRTLVRGLRQGKEAVLKTEFLNARGKSILMTMRCNRCRHPNGDLGLSGALTYETAEAVRPARTEVPFERGREEAFEYLPVALVRINPGRGRWRGNASFRSLQLGDDTELLDQVREAVKRVELSGMRFVNRALCSKEGKVWQLYVSRCPERNRSGELIIEACIIPGGVHDFGLEALLRSYRKLQDQKLKNEQFMAILAHELRNPLAALTSTFSLLCADQDSQTMGWCKEVIERQLTILRRLIDDLLDVSRIELETIELKKERVELAPIVRRVLSSIGPRISERRQSLSIELPDEPIHLHADAVRLEQILGNLLSNAIKFTPCGGTIRLGVKAEGERVSLEVEDNGAGIPAEMLQEIFELFTRAERSEDRIKGLGIGLTVVRKLVELHKGEVTAFSAGSGKGSKFIVTLPQIKKGPQRLEPVCKRLEFKRSGQVLIVEDNQDAAQALALLLQSSGYETRIALNGCQALDLARRESIEIMLIDLDLPDINGFSVIKQLQDERLLGGVRIICLSGYSRHEDRERARTLGVFRYLVKPVEFADLLALLPEECAQAANG